jgi:AcrR family transcriptional regulator
MARMVTEPRNARSRRSRAALLRAARELVESEGVTAVTMAAVAERAGVTRRAVYLHFASRADLISELFDYVNEIEDIQGRFAPISDAPDAVTALMEFARRHAQYMPRILAVARAVERVAPTDPDAARHWETAMYWRYETNRALIQRLDEEGVLDGRHRRRHAARAHLQRGERNPPGRTRLDGRASRGAHGPPAPRDLRRPRRQSQVVARGRRTR